MRGAYACVNVVFDFLFIVSCGSFTQGEHGACGRSSSSEKICN